MTDNDKNSRGSTAVALIWYASDRRMNNNYKINFYLNYSYYILFFTSSAYAYNTYYQHTCAQTHQTVFTARRYASAVYAVIIFLSLCLSDTSRYSM